MSWFRNWLKRGQKVIDLGRAEYPEIQDISLSRGAEIISNTTQRTIDDANLENEPELQPSGNIADGVDAININYSPDILLDYNAASSGSVIPDISGNGRDFTLQGTEGVDFTWLPGSGHLANASGRISMNLGSTFTLDTTFGVDGHTVFIPAKTDLTGAIGYLFDVEADRLTIYNPASGIAYFDDTNYETFYDPGVDNEFSYAISYSTSGGNFYVNGLPILRGGGKDINLLSGQRMTIGTRFTGSDPSSGDYDGFFMYKNATLTDEEIYTIYQYASGQKHYYREVVVNELGISGVCEFFYPTWEIDGTDAMDVSGSGNHGSYAGTPTLGQANLDDYTLHSFGGTTTGYIDAINNTISVVDDFTIAGVCEAGATGLAGIFSIGGSNNYIGLWQNTSSSVLRLASYYPTTGVNAPIPSGDFAWCVRRRGDVLSWWINGIRREDLTIDSASYASNVSLRIRTWAHNGVGAYNRNMQHRGTYSTALDSDDCRRLSELDPRPRTELEAINTVYSPDLLLDFGAETNGTAIIPDISGNGRNFTADGTEGVDFNWRYKQGHLTRIPGRIELTSGARWTSDATFSNAHSFVIPQKVDMTGVVGFSFDISSGRLGLFAEASQLAFTDGTNKGTPYDGGIDNEFMLGLVHDHVGSATASVFVNGLRVFSAAAASVTLNSGATWKIGENSGAELNRASGDYDGFFLYKNDAITDIEMYEIYQRSTGQSHFWKEKVEALNLESDCVFHIPCWEIDGAGAIDASGNEKHSAISTGVSLGEPPIGPDELYSFALTSNAHKVLVPTPGVDVSVAFSFFLRLKSTDDSGNRCILDITDGTSRITLNYRNAPDNDIYIIFDDGTSSVTTIFTDLIVAPNQENAICLRSDGTTVRCAMNGTESAITSDISSLSLTSMTAQDWWIGDGDTGASPGVVGFISLLTGFDVSLSQADAESLTML